MARVLVGVTGSVAAIRTPALVETLRGNGHEVRVVATEPSLYFFDLDEIRNPAGAAAVPVYRDADEWAGSRYSRGDRVLHIELRDWAEMLVIAPLDAHTLARLAVGLSDNLLACLLRAWDFDKPIMLAPAMNTRMWESPVTLRHLRQIYEDHAIRPWDPKWTLKELPEAFAENCARIVLIPPQAKRLACGDFGMGAMAEVPRIAALVQAWSVAEDTLGPS